MEKYEYLELKGIDVKDCDPIKYILGKKMKIESFKKTQWYKDFRKEEPEFGDDIDTFDYVRVTVYIHAPNRVNPFVGFYWEGGWNYYSFQMKPQKISSEDLKRIKERAE